MSDAQATNVSKFIALGFGALCFGLVFVAAQLGNVLEVSSMKQLNNNKIVNQDSVFILTGRTEHLWNSRGTTSRCFHVGNVLPLGQRYR
jgi:hypothetical protein